MEREDTTAIASELAEAVMKELRKEAVIYRGPEPVKTLEACRDQFLFYAEQHRCKGTFEADEKAKVNEDWADRCFKAIQATKLAANSQVFVVMGNDYPDAVFDSEEKAQAYIKTQSDEVTGHKIYWRAYPFTLG